MKKQVLFFALCYYTGLLNLIVWWKRHLGQRLIILNYHRAGEGDLRRHLLYLRRHYRILHLEEALEELYGAGKPEAIKSDRRTPLIITFDDGYRDLYTLGFPIAKELRVPINIFIIPGYIESGNCFWWHVGDHFVEHAQVKVATIEERTYLLDRPTERKALAQAIYMHARYAQSVAGREAFLTTVREALAVPPTVLGEKESVLNWEEIREMQESGRVSFGAHTMHHPVLAYLKDPTEVQLEVSECRAAIEQQLDRPIRTFAYPIGRPEHIGEAVIGAVQSAGYAWAVTTTYGINTPETHPLQLHRIEVDVARHWLLLASDTAGIRHALIPLFSQASMILDIISRMISRRAAIYRGHRRFIGPASGPIVKFIKLIRRQIEGDDP